MNYQIRIFYSLAITLIASLSSYGQNITERNWLFGNSENYLVFDKSGINVVEEDDKAIPFGTGGSAVITDQFTGDLLFYTDGQLVYDRYHDPVPAIAGGLQLSGNNSKNQAAVTCPVPGSLTEYLIFTNSDTAINYSIIDASVAGNGTATFPLGDLTDSVNQSMNLPEPSEGMIIIEQGE